MTMDIAGRRRFLKQIAAAAASLPVSLGADRVMAFGRSGRAASTVRPHYDPAATFDLDVTEVELRKNAAGRVLMARVYRPKGPGPFPTLLDLHGGAWNAKNRRAEEPMDRAIASSGAVVVAIDMTLAPEAPYPASVQDANYAVRWLKARAGAWNGD